MRVDMQGGRVKKNTMGKFDGTFGMGFKIGLDEKPTFGAAE